MCSHATSKKKRREKKRVMKLSLFRLKKKIITMTKNE